MYVTILAATDGSDGARRAVRRAVELASLFNADLHLLYVADSDQFSTDKPRDVVAELLADAEAAGEEHLRELEELALEGGVDHVHREVRRGVPHAEILDYADAHEVELVVMGTHGESGYESVHLGSTAEEVARRTERPLLLT